jgi:2-polyprenyl-6-methoxyphenol hydroxylase-like FAD-dependent oxidoreductase
VVLHFRFEGANPISHVAAADVLIVGAGPAGLALAAALSDVGLSALLVEQQPRDALDKPADDGREIALTHRARRVMAGLGIWQRLPESEAAPLRRAHALDGDSPAMLRFAASGDDARGWLVPNHEIRRAALAEAVARPGVRLLCAARVTALEQDGALARVTLADGRRLAAPLVVAADSRLSQTRRLAGIGASMHDFGRSVVVGRVGHERANEGIALECFRYGNTLALLPMNRSQSSAVITVAADRAAECWRWTTLRSRRASRRRRAAGSAPCAAPARGTTTRWSASMRIVSSHRASH